MIELPEVKVKPFEVCLKWLYSGGYDIDFTVDRYPKIVDELDTADFLSIGDLQEEIFRSFSGVVELEGLKDNHSTYLPLLDFFVRLVEKSRITNTGLTKELANKIVVSQSAHVNAGLAANKSEKALAILVNAYKEKMAKHFPESLAEPPEPITRTPSQAPCTPKLLKSGPQIILLTICKMTSQRFTGSGRPQAGPQYRDKGGPAQPQKSHGGPTPPRTDNGGQTQPQAENVFFGPKETFKFLSGDTKYTDVRLLVGKEGKPLYFHACALAAGSPYFHAKLSPPRGRTVERRMTLKLPALTYRGVKRACDWLYGNPLPRLDAKALFSDVVYETYLAAQYLGIPSLTRALHRDIRFVFEENLGLPGTGQSLCYRRRDPLLLLEAVARFYNEKSFDSYMYLARIVAKEIYPDSKFIRRYTGSSKCDGMFFTALMTAYADLVDVVRGEARAMFASYEARLNELRARGKSGKKRR
ncbi:hypothetical protein H072_186 [Dactylellina haptotyla CBS 200.50]|uniref:BTB domain-containing protein n=1 Tax=Dactylellina haptotyla (strain CBS 200.50) TaxID=1284197 RepID=S8ASQ0_DACHA|nr:hypothetical protein H072_186 [Dactylellina haptotyla CBS 200.50]